MKEATEIALDFCKQQLMFAGILISATVAFYPQYLPNMKGFGEPITVAAWSVLFISVAFGLLFFGSVTHDLRELVTRAEEKGSAITAGMRADILSHKREKTCYIGQFLCLMMGTALLFSAVIGFVGNTNS